MTLKRKNIKMVCVEKRIKMLFVTKMESCVSYNSFKLYWMGLKRKNPLASWPMDSFVGGCFY